ncbi:Uncharacterized protein TCM_015700 [Theobroma cacao]|uniref:Uncharacterized protein n=1 Tax=Theobroma cacao TaxID=3641 RepID=A0A061GAA7_THECC|nr:Uncharacterized protein TCM_015700 [Theobroma cacao]
MDKHPKFTKQVGVPKLIKVFLTSELTNILTKPLVGQIMPPEPYPIMPRVTQQKLKANPYPNNETRWTVVQNHMQFQRSLL